ncbi:uncharacterized protein [Dermacentor albipictus]
MHCSGHDHPGTTLEQRAPHKRRHTDSAFPPRALDSPQRPVGASVRERFPRHATVVTGEHDEAVAEHATSMQGLDDAADVLVQCVHRPLYPDTSPPGLMEAIANWKRPVPQPAPVCCCFTTVALLCSLMAGILAVLVYIAVILRDISQALHQSDREVSQTTSRGIRAIRGRSGSAEAAVYCSVGASLQAQYKPQARTARNTRTDRSSHASLGGYGGAPTGQGSVRALRDPRMDKNVSAFSTGAAKQFSYIQGVCPDAEEKNRLQLPTNESALGRGI